MDRLKAFDNLKYVYVTCPVCGNDDYHYLIRFGYHQRFQYVRCNTCSTIYTNPRFHYDDNFIKLTYGENFHIYQKLKKKYNTANNKELDVFIQDNLNSNVIKFRYQILEKYVKPGKYLDVGCALGGYLLYGNKNGWTTYGTEICEPMYRFCRDKLHLQVYNKQLEDIKFKSSMFDAISLYHVIEHLPNPVVIMRELHRILKPNGIALIETPNCDALETRLKRLLIEIGLKKWNIAKGLIPGHLFEFNLKSFKYICGQLNFQLLYAHTYSHKNNTDRLSLRHLLNLGTKYRFIIRKR